MDGYDFGARFKHNQSGLNEGVSKCGDQGVAWVRDPQQIIIEGVNNLPPMQNSIYTNTLGEERKRRRENEHGSFSSQNLTTDVLLLDCPEDDRSATLFLTAGSGVGAGRTQ